MAGLAAVPVVNVAPGPVVRVVLFVPNVVGVPVVALHKKMSYPMEYEFPEVLNDIFGFI